jgi:uncharacterized protein YqfA (UPF0365 family)
MKDNIIIAISLIMVVFCLLSLIVFFLTIRFWIRAILCGVRVSIGQIIAMRLRGNPPGLIIDTIFTLGGRGIATTAAKVESVYIENRGQILTPSQLADLVVQKDEDRREVRTKPMGS